MPYVSELGQAWAELCLFSVSVFGLHPVGWKDDPSFANKVLVGSSSTASTSIGPCLLAVQTVHRHLKGSLRTSWDSIQSWIHGSDASMRSPLPLLILNAICNLGRLWAWSFYEAGQFKKAWLWLRWSAVVETAFFGLLRPGEVCNLLRKHLCLAHAQLNSCLYATLAVVRAKNRRSMGRIQFASVRSQRTSSWLAFLYKHADREQPAWPFGAGRMLNMFRRALAAAHVDPCAFSLGSLRAGGASCFFQSGIEPGRLKFWGRWASEASCAHYVQERSAYFILGSLPEGRLDQLERLSAPLGPLGIVDGWCRAADVCAHPGAWR